MAGKETAEEDLAQRGGLMNVKLEYATVGKYPESVSICRNNAVYGGSLYYAQCEYVHTTGNGVIKIIKKPMIQQSKERNPFLHGLAFQASIYVFPFVEFLLMSLAFSIAASPRVALLA